MVTIKRRLLNKDIILFKHYICDDSYFKYNVFMAEGRRDINSSRFKINKDRITYVPDSYLTNFKLTLKF